MKIRIFIVTYKGEQHLRDNLDSLFSSYNFSDHEIEINVINNHTKFFLDDHYKDRVKVYHNQLRPDFSTGHLSRNWNQAIINGFESLVNPACELLIHTQDDILWKKEWLSILFPIMERRTFYQSGNGDAFCCYRVEAVKRIGIWDERYCNIGYQEYDYFLRAVLYNGDKTSLNDIGECIRTTWNPEEQVVVHVQRDADKHNSHQLSIAYHPISSKVFAHKWGFETSVRDNTPNYWEWVRENVKSTLTTNFMFYPYFEKHVEDLHLKNYLV
jgi:hypothetical protein